MVTVNEASQFISAAVKSGWKLGSATTAELEWSEAKVNKTVEPVEGALSTLRSIYQEQGNLAKIVDVERAALGVVSKLNSLQMYKLALGLLEGVRPSLLSLLGAPEIKESRPKSRSARAAQRPPPRAGTSKGSSHPYLPLLSLPQLPESSSFTDAASTQSLAIALATYQAHAIKSVLAVLDSTQLHDLYKTLIAPEFLLTRAPPQPTTLPADQLSALFVGAFQSIAGSPALSPRPPEPTTSSTVRKTSSSRAPSVTRTHTRTASASGTTKASSASSAKPATKPATVATPNSDELALLCRKEALLILARSPSVEKDMNLFWDQATKWGAVYVKSVSALPSPPTEEQIAQTLSTFFSDLIAAVPSERQCGPRFETLCEWWMRFAKKVKDAETIQKITYLLHPPSTPKRPARENPTEPPPIAKAKSSSTAKLSRSALLAALDRAVLTTTPDDMYAAAEALNTLNNDWAADDSTSIRRLVNTISDLRKACVRCWTREDESGPEEGGKGAVRAVVDAMVKCTEKPGFPHEITVSAIDALLTLSRSELDPQDYESYSRSNLAIDKALKLADLASTQHQTSTDDPSSSGLSSKTHATLLRAVSNTAYTLAGILYNANLAAKGIPFAEQAWKKPAGAGRRGATAKRGARAGESSSAPLPAKKSNVAFEDPTGLVQSMDMLAQVLGLLGHTFLKLQFMHLVLWVCEECSEAETTEAYIRTSIDLSNVYLELGQVENATNILARANEIAGSNASRIDISTLVMLRLLYADILARSQQIEQSVKTYEDALELSEQIEAVDKHAAYMVKTQARLQALQRSAIACGVYASIQASKDDTVSMLAGLTQALRLWNRAVDILLRLSEKTQPVAPAEPANPFEVQNTKSTALDELSQAKKTVSRVAILDGIQWQIAQGLLRTIFDLGEAYSIRGSVREAEFFLAQACSLSESLQAPLGVGRSLIRQAELKMARGLLDEGLEMLAKAEDIVADPVGVDTAALHCFLGHHRQREASADDAHAMYAQAGKILDQLDTLLTGLRQRQSGPKAASEMLVPEVRGQILKERIWLSQIGEVEPEDQVSVGELDKLPQSLKLKSEQASLLGRIALYEVFSQFRSDLFLSSLTESAIAVPMGMTSKDPTAMQTASTRDALNALGAAEQNFWNTLQLSVARGDAIRTREAATNLARILAFQSSLGKQGVEGAVLTATLLDYSNATTLRREMLDAIVNKEKATLSGDDLVWPTPDTNRSPSRKLAQKPRGLFALSQEPDEDLEVGGQEMRQYWRFLKEKYSNSSFDPSITQQLKLLPKHWTVVTINVTDDKTALIVSRQRPHHPPVIFCLPLDRRGKEDDEERFDYDDAMDELTSILETSDRITHEGVNIEGNKDAIAEWWSERTTLDQRMRELLDNIEFCWLGVFKMILAVPFDHAPDTLSLLRSRVDKAFKRNGIGSDKTSTRPKLDKGLLDCFASISPKCRDEELEDLAYFVLDLYQLHGISIALSEVDVDTLVVDLRNALEEHAQKTKPRSTLVGDHHLFLVLDKNVQRIPWESLPILRGQSVSRIPSVSFLVDRVQLAGHHQGVPFVANPGDAADRVCIDPTRVQYVLNPKGDLKHTEKQFSPWLKRMTKEAGWTGIIGRKPSEEEMARSLAGADLFMYFGHGGGEQFIRSQKVRHLQRCAAAMLWGCSSGAMRDMGDFDPVGTPYHYMLAGCPTLIATLWDVTDRECDRFAQSVFTSLKLNEPRSKTSNEREGTSVVQAVASAREVCKLKYLTDTYDNVMTTIVFLSGRSLTNVNPIRVLSK
ncbi:hypothetical protein FRC06_000783 [Ceratobasidium sp. 370]|nr:hypothetical protein FRC06_000783 [Ceratobasidium sp. 370]